MLPDDQFQLLHLLGMDGELRLLDTVAVGIIPADGLGIAVGICFEIDTRGQCLSSLRSQQRPGRWARSAAGWRPRGCLRLVGGAWVFTGWRGSLGTAAPSPAPQTPRFLLAQALTSTALNSKHFHKELIILGCLALTWFWPWWDRVWVSVQSGHPWAPQTAAHHTLSPKISLSLLLLASSFPYFYW